MLTSAQNLCMSNELYSCECIKCLGPKCSLQLFQVTAMIHTLNYSAVIISVPEN